MGWIGKSALLVTPEYGPRVRLGTVLTSMELPVKGEIPVVGCGDCCLCRLMCPAMAIHGNNWHMGADRLELVDAAACSIYMNENFKHIGRGSVCGICMRVCPAGRRVIR
jgi:epoxyqueuosine reductase QueG